tara:strand:+ start:345 stop:1202 length:858 start_codon:yes stop_codon:yes gene_type:complete
MIIWLASYPKSGNTLVRSMISAYFFSKDGIYNFDLINNIKQFPKIGLFQKIGINIKDDKEVIKNYVKVQNTFNTKNSLQFLKTHSYLFNFENKYPFTDLKNSLGVIYIVRDPRNIINSFAKFWNTPQEKIAEIMINDLYMGGDFASEKIEDRTKVWTGTWSSNFQSWKSFKFQERYLLVKYEDLIANPEEVFLKILEFIYQLNKKKFNLNKSKLNNVIKTTKFESMQLLEKKIGFNEAKINDQTGEKIPFFNLGPKNDWKNSLDGKIRFKIEKAFKKEMQELNYL